MVTGSANQSAPAEQLTAMQKERIAIIGVGCRFPAGVSSKDSLWKLLVEGREGIIEVPPDRWGYAHIGFQTLTAIFLVLTAFGIFLKPGPGPFAVGLTAFLFSSGTAYLNSLEYLFQGPPRKKRNK